MRDPITKALKEALVPVVEEAVEKAVRRQLKHHSAPSAEGNEREKAVLSNAEARRFMDVSKSTLHRWRNSGLLPFHKVRGKILYRRDDLLRVLEEHRVEN